MAQPQECLGREWQHFDQSEFSEEEARRSFDDYFAIFDFAGVDEGFDLGCESDAGPPLTAEQPPGTARSVVDWPSQVANRSRVWQTSR